MPLYISLDHENANQNLTMINSKVFHVKATKPKDASGQTSLPQRTDHHQGLNSYSAKAIASCTLPRNISCLRPSCRNCLSSTKSLHNIHLCPHGQSRTQNSHTTQQQQCRQAKCKRSWRCPASSSRTALSSSTAARMLYLTLTSLCSSQSHYISILFLLLGSQLTFVKQ